MELITLLAPIAALVGSLGTLFLTKILDERRDRRIAKERFFDNFFPMRIKAHEEIIRTVTDLGIHNSVSSATTPYALHCHYEQALGVLSRLYTTNLVFSSLDVLAALNRLCEILIDAAHLNLEIPDVVEPAIWNEEIRSRFESVYEKLLEAARRDSGVDLIDRGFQQVAQFPRVAKQKAKKPRESN